MNAAVVITLDNVEELNNFVDLISASWDYHAVGEQTAKTPDDRAYHQQQRSVAAEMWVKLKSVRMRADRNKAS